MTAGQVVRFVLAFLPVTAAAAVLLDAGIFSSNDSPDTVAVALRAEAAVTRGRRDASPTARAAAPGRTVHRRHRTRAQVDAERATESAADAVPSECSTGTCESVPTADEPAPSAEMRLEESARALDRDQSGSGDGFDQAHGGGAAIGATKQTGTSVLMWALQWLKTHQARDGRWSSDGFDAQCKLNRCDGSGEAGRDAATTGLALLAFLGAGETHQSGTFKETVKNGLKHLRGIQDFDGCFGARTSAHFLRDHAIAALAMVEAYGITCHRVFKEPARRGIAFALKTRTPGGGWNRAAPADRVVDVETTGWMVMLLKSAVMSELDVEPAAIDEAVDAIDRFTDRESGRVVVWGGAGGPQSDETATAIGVLVRILGGATIESDPQFLNGADVLAGRPPDWNFAAGTIDFAYWYFASLAMFQTGGEHWAKWSEAMKPALLDHVRSDPDRDERGSWDPVGPGAAELGRVGSTALSALCLESYYRYGRVFNMDLR